MTKTFVRIVDSFYLLTIFEKKFHHNVSQNIEATSLGKCRTYLNKFLQLKADICKRALVRKGIISKIAYVGVLTHQILSFQHNSSEFLTRSKFTSHPFPCPP